MFSSAPARRRAVAAVLGLALPAAPALAALFNVSYLVNGTGEPTPVYVPGGNLPVACGAACRHVTASTTGMTNAYDMTPGPYTAAAWPPAYGPSQPSVVSVEESLAIAPGPNGETLDGGAIGVLQRSRVRYDWQPIVGGERHQAVQTWKTGSGANVVSYGIRIETPAGNPRRTYLEFAVPALARGWQHAYYVGGPSGNQPITTDTRRLQTRSAVDVYIDGLAVWSSADHLLKPQRYDPPFINNLGLKWGEPLGGENVTLFLGSLPGGSTRTVAMVIRTDLRVDAPTCHNDSEFGTTYRRCHSQKEQLSLPSVSQPWPYLGFRPDIKVYTR